VPGNDSNPKNPEADFFGDDDVDWLDDDDSEVIERKSPKRAVPGAPPPPPAMGPSVLPKDQGRPGHDRNLAYGNELSRADTLIFSDVPTLAEEDGPELGDLDTVEVHRDGPAFVAEDDLPTTHVSEADQRAAIERARSMGQAEPAPLYEPESDLDGFEGDEFDADPDSAAEDTPLEAVVEDEGAETPLVQTKEPAPIRMEIPERPPASPTLTPWSSPRPTLPPFDAADGDDNWRMMTATLITEASVAGPEERGELLFRAGWVFRHRLGDLQGAEALYRDALTSNCRNPALYRELADVCIQLARWEEAAVTLHERATLLDGIQAAESLRECAVVHLRRLQNPGDGVARLWDSLEANREDYASLVLLRDALSDVQPERAEILKRIAEVADGALAAEAWTERGRLLRNVDANEAITAYMAAREADPHDARPFIALEQMLEARGRLADRAAMYEAEERRDRDGAGWWALLAGRDHIDAGDHAKADAAYTRAAAAGWAFATDERRARLFANGAWEPLVAHLVREVEAGPPEATTWFRIGWIRENHLDDGPGALQAYERASALAPGARPPRDAIKRLHERHGQPAELVADLQAELGSVAEAERPTHLFRMGEVAELAGDLKAARAHFEAALDADPDLWPARAGHTRVLRALGDAAAVVTAYRERAARVSSPELRAHFLFSAAMGAPTVQEGAFELLLEALANQPAHLPSLELLGSVCSTTEQWRAYATALVDAGSSVADTDVRVHLYYLAARVHGARTGDIGAAKTALARCLELVPDFLAARRLSFDLSAVGRDTVAVCRAYREEAEQSTDPAARAWLLFASGVMSDPRSLEGRTDLDAVLAHVPDHPGARALIAEVRAALEDHANTIAHHQAELRGTPTTHTSRVSVRLAHLLVQQGRGDDAREVLSDLARMSVEGRPLWAGAIQARLTGATTAEATLLGAIDAPWARVQRASLLARRRRDRDAAREQAAAVLAADERHVGAALVLSRIGTITDDVRMSADAQATIARHASGEAIRFANAMWAADAYEQLDAIDEALDLYRLAASLQPESEAASLGIARCLIHRKDTAALFTLAKEKDLDPMSLATALSHLQAPKEAIALLRTAARAHPALPALLQLENALEAIGDWEGAYDVLLRRLEASRDENQRDLVERKQRWMLAEKLPETDAAWNLYRRLHDQSPEDRAITEALARIAGARRETAMAIAFLSELAGSAETPAESARYKRRVADAHLSNGDRTAARQAYLDALDYVPSDAESLAGLKTMATEEEDWTGLVQILEREAMLSDAERALTLRREIALVHEDRIGNRPVAIEAWRAVLEQEPQDLEALDHLLALTESEANWPLFVEIASIRAALSVGADRTRLLCRIGVVSADELRRDDAIRFFERATTEEPPDYEAAQRLEAHFRQRGDWKGVARALDVQGRAAPTDELRVAALEKAATLELENRHDRDAAAAVYDRILTVDANHETALRFMASHLFESGRFDEAMPVCERLEPVVEKDQDLDDFDTRMELAQFYFYYAEMLRLAEEDGALERYERALELNQTHLASLEAVGPLLCKAEKWKRAEVVYRQLLQLSGGQGERHKVASTYTQLGLVERALGRSEKAQKRFNKALEIYPNHVDALKGMAHLLEDREDWSNLLNIYNNVIYHASVAEDVIAGYMTKGRVLDDHMARPDKAAQHYQRSLDFKPDQPFAYLRLAELAMRKDDYEGAAQLAGKALKVESAETDQVRHLLLLVQAAHRTQQGRTSDASDLLERARELGGEEVRTDALADLEMLRQFIKQRLPPT
jgi:tetratricopeptide (TPR) repeat protein